MDADSKTYRATCRECGNVTMLVVENAKRPKDVANAVAKAIRDGDQVELIDSEWVRTADWSFCECGQEEAVKQPALL